MRINTGINPLTKSIVVNIQYSKTVAVNLKIDFLRHLVIITFCAVIE